MNLSLLEAADLSRPINRNAGSSGGTVKGTILDMSGFEGVTFVAAFQDVLTTAAVTLKVAGGAVNDTGQMSLLAGGAAFTAGATDMDNKLMVLDVVRPTQRFIEVQVAIGTANAPIDSVVAIRWRSRKSPRTQGANVVASAISISPAVA
jgi:hypothetical protein